MTSRPKTSFDTPSLESQTNKAETMLSISGSARINRPAKEFHLSEGEEMMRSDRLSPLTKPRSVTRRVEDDYNQTMIEEQFSSIKEFDLEQPAVFDIADLKPLETKQFQNLEAYPYAFETDQDVLIWACALLSESPIALALLREAKESQWKITVTDLGTGGFHLDTAEKILELDHYGLDTPSLGRSSFFRTSILCVLAKALREIWHENRWGAFENDFKPEAVLMLERARAADADAVSILIGWELRSAGYNEIWRHILGSDDGDMAQVLVNILERYPTALYNGMALAHIFRQWYADTARVDAMDHATLEQMDFNLRDWLVKPGDKNATSQEFENLSTLPDGSVYLDGLGDTVSRDPFFCDVADPINQAHLFQIVYDSKVTYVDGIPFRDPKLARKFFSAD